MAYGNITATTSVQKMISANNARYKVYIRNFGDGYIYIGDDTSTTAGNGFPIQNAEEWVEMASQSGEMYKGDIYVITASGTQDVRWIERLLT